MSPTLKHLYRFDSFVLDVDERVLLRDGRMIPMTPKVFETLLLLVKNQGSIVTKQTILETLWQMFLLRRATLLSTSRCSEKLSAIRNSILFTYRRFLDGVIDSRPKCERSWKTRLPHTGPK